jgi:hypothetical protein
MESAVDAKRTNGVDDHWGAIEIVGELANDMTRAIIMFNCAEWK